LRPSPDKSLRAYYSSVAQDAVTSAQQVGLAIVFLPHQAWISADAIVRTLWRLGVSRRNLLEWQSASLVERLATGGARSAGRSMWQSPALAMVAVTTAVTVEILRRQQDVPSPDARLWLLLAAAVPLAAAWIAAPA